MEISAYTAEAGLANLTETTQLLTAASLTFGDQSASAMQRYSDATTLAVQLGVGYMDTFNTGFANVMGTAAAVGMTFEDMAATTAFLTQRGVDAASAGTYLNNALSKLIKPGEELQSVFQER
jgi:TP901 family phage tail tape measure protein